MDFMPDFITDFVVDVLTWLGDTLTGAEPWQQFFVILLAGAIPFVESYLASFFTVLLGVTPWLAVPAAILGNWLCMMVLTALTGGARDAATRGRDPKPEQETSRSRRRVAKYVDRFGVPGVCFLTPLVLPTMITAPILVGFGASRRNVYLYMTLSIIAWGVLFGVFSDWVMTWYGLG
ncbi:hypothetical protein [Nesterenkonia flava]|uniref:Small multi-drug export protein n=1 Tax=Nesterenkonia flava TaxID=469799 RepID=A0ABU1FUL9_9MICC|nr:hypothetical protein [Nesterenkonia flava]MDR5712363.1 hypothetical protein [Nesterenkonia flava]